MIDEAITFLQRHLSRGLPADPDPAAGGAGEGNVVLPDLTKLTDRTDFRPAAVSLLLLNLEEEHTLRPGDPFVRVAVDGSRLKVAPEVRLNLLVLFVPNFSTYSDSLKQLSLIIGHFQAHRVLNHANAPDLSERIEQLIIELMTPSFSELNEIWGALRTACRPSVLYKVRMIVFKTADGLPATEVREIRMETRL